jgi:hypothetical protein
LEFVERGAARKYFQDSCFSPLRNARMSKAGAFGVKKLQQEDQGSSSSGQGEKQSNAQARDKAKTAAAASAKATGAGAALGVDKKKFEPPTYKHSCGNRCKLLYGDPAFPAYKKFTIRQVANEGFCVELKKMPDGSKQFCCPYNKADNDKNLCQPHYDELLQRDEERRERQAEWEERKAALEAGREAYEERQRRREERARLGIDDNGQGGADDGTAPDVVQSQ